MLISPPSVTFICCVAPGVGVFYHGPAFFWHSYERHDRYFRSMVVFFLISLKAFLCTSDFEGGVYHRGLNSGKQPANADFEWSSDLKQQEVPGEEKHGWKASEKRKALPTSRSFGNCVCVSETTVVFAVWKGCSGLNSAIRFWHMALIGVNGSPLSASEGTAWPLLLVFTHYIFMLWHPWAGTISTAHSL